MDTHEDLPTKWPPATVNLTTDNARAMLIEARGDIFIASQMLHVSAIRLNRAIQVAPELQATLDGIEVAGKGASNEAIQSAIEKRLLLYRVAGLDALHDLATMPIDENSAQNQVKLAAAARLAGTQEHAGGSSEMAEVMRELNRQYEENAPRIRVTRERMTIETVPERVVGEQGTG